MLEYARATKAVPRLMSAIAPTLPLAETQTRGSRREDRDAGPCPPSSTPRGGRTRRPAGRTPTARGFPRRGANSLGSRGTRRLPADPAAGKRRRERRWTRSTRACSIDASTGSREPATATATTTTTSSARRRRGSRPDEPRARLTSASPLASPSASTTPRCERFRRLCACGSRISGIRTSRGPSRPPPRRASPRAARRGV